MTDKRPSKIAPWMVIIGLVVAVLVFWNSQVQDQKMRDHYACLDGDYSRCEPVP